QETERIAPALGLSLVSEEVREPSDLQSAFETARGHADAAVVLDDTMVFRNADRIAALAARNRWPLIAGFQEHARPARLMAYGPNVPALSGRAVYYVDRIFKSPPPADLPIEQPMTFDFVINLQTAQALGLTIPSHVLLQATEVIHRGAALTPSLRASE